MRYQALLAAACLAAAVGGCSTNLISTAPYCVPPPPGLSPSLRIGAQEDARPQRAVFVDEPSPLRRLRRTIRRAAKPASVRPEKAPAQSEPARYSDEWWEQQKRGDDKVKERMIICRNC